MLRLTGVLFRPKCSLKSAIVVNVHRGHRQKKVINEAMLFFCLFIYLVVVVYIPLQKKQQKQKKKNDSGMCLSLLVTSYGTESVPGIIVLGQRALFQSVVCYIVLSKVIRPFMWDLVIAATRTQIALVGSPSRNMNIGE